MPALHSALCTRGDLVEILYEPVHHPLLAAFDHGDSRIAEGLCERVALVVQGVMVSGDDHCRWKPAEIGQNRTDRRIVWRDIAR